MPLTPEALRDQKVHYHKRTTQFAEAGYDRFGAPTFILDQAVGLAGPLLDVGTGTGITARAAAGRGLEVVAVDSCADDLQVAASLTEEMRLAGRIRYLLADAARLPVADGHFGSAAAVDFLHHLDDGAPILAEIMRVVRLGGLIVLADFSREGFDMVARIHAAEGREHPEGPVTLDRAREFLAGLGATEVARASGHLHHVAVFRKPAIG